MTRFIKGLALFVALCSLVWVGVLWHWQSTRHEASVRDIVLFLGVLPLLLFALLLLARSAWRAASAGRPSVDDARRDADASPAPTVTPSVDEAARHTTWQLLAAHGNTCIGSRAEEWLAAVEANQPMPSLDSELRDADGLPVMTARVKTVDATPVLDELEPVLAPLQPLHPTLALSASFVRALALLREPLAAAAAELAPWADALGTPVQDRTRDPDRPQTTASTLADARVGVLVAWPDGLNALELQVAHRWLHERLVHAGDGWLHASRWSVVAATEASASPIPTSAGPLLWQQADAWFQARCHDECLDVLLLMATHSEIAVDALEDLQAQGRLFGSRNPKGMIPGEAAVALLLAPASWPTPPGADAPAPHLHRAALAARDMSITAAGRSTHDVLGHLVAQAIASARLAPDAIGTLINDADQHTTRSAELFGAMLEQLPHLDATEEMRMFGQLCGDIGACSTLMSAAIAAHEARLSEQPCLALSLGDTHWRAALVARPGAPPSADALSASAAAKPTASPAG